MLINVQNSCRSATSMVIGDYCHMVLSALQHVEKPLAQWQNVNAVFAYTWHHLASAKNIGVLFYCLPFLAKNFATKGIAHQSFNRWR